MSMSPWPSFSEEEACAVQRVLLSNQVNYWTGEEGRQFELEYANCFSVAKSVAVANGTIALEGALLALGIGAGDEVIVTPRSFIASASSIVNVGARPVFADVDLSSQNLDPLAVEAAIGPATRAILAVHLAGWPCEMEALNELAHAHGLYIVEDCAQAHGALYKGAPVGGLGDIGAWSFCQDKIISTGGEGGMLTTNDEGLWSRVWSWKDHGKSWDAVYKRTHPPGFRWLHESFGTNGRMTELQAAVGRIQLKHLPGWHVARANNANAILDAAAECEVYRVPRPPSHVEHAWYKCYFFVRPERLSAGWDRDRIMNEIVRRGVPCYSGSCPEVYLERAFQDAGLAPSARLPVARELGDTSLMFLVHPTLTEAEIALTCEVIRSVGQMAKR